MTFDYHAWGTLAAFGPDSALLDFSELFVSRDDARNALNRDPDFRDSRITSWGRLTLADAERLAALEPEPEWNAGSLAAVRDLFSLTGVAIVTLYYSDSRNGY